MQIEETNANGVYRGRGGRHSVPGMGAASRENSSVQRVVGRFSRAALQRRGWRVSRQQVSCFGVNTNNRISLLTTCDKIEKPGGFPSTVA